MYVKKQEPHLKPFENSRDVSHPVRTAYVRHPESHGPKCTTKDDQKALIVLEDNQRISEGTETRRAGRMTHPDLLKVLRLQLTVPSTVSVSLCYCTVHFFRAEV